MRIHSAQSLYRVHGIAPAPSRAPFLKCLNAIRDGLRRRALIASRRRQYASMAHLPDEILRDIGLTRDDIQAAQLRAKRGVLVEDLR